MLLDLRREVGIKHVLRCLSRQRVAMVLEGNVWVIEKAVMSDPKTDAILLTCWMRGWVEPIEKAMPNGKLTKEGGLPPGQLFDSVGPLYRLTDSGWTVIRRSHTWLLVSLLIAFLSLLATVYGWRGWPF